MNKIYLLSPWVNEKYDPIVNSLEYIKFYLIDSGYQAKIINCAEYNRDLNDVISILKGDERPIVGVTAYTRERFNAYELIKRIRREIQGSLIVVGGRHFSSLPEETLFELPEVDIVVRGEGEITFKEICDSVYNNTGFEGVAGISYKKGSEIIHNPERPMEPDLDKFRCFDLNDIRKYTSLSHTKTDSKNLYFTVFATRGCPSNCVFCSLKADRVRFRSIDNIIEEIEAKIKATGIRNVSFSDSSLTLNRKFITTLCEKIIEKKINIRWNCYSRADVNSNILKIMKKGGLEFMEIAMESGSSSVLKSIKKNVKLEHFEQLFKEGYNLGIKIYVFCMISLPGEKLEDVDMTIAYIKKVSKYIFTAGMQVARILPDAALYEISKGKNILPDDFTWFKDFHRVDKYGISNKYYATLPIYLEQLALEDIRDKMNEFNDLFASDFASFDTIKRSLKSQFRGELIKEMTFKEFYRKSKRATKMFITAFNNKGKFSQGSSNL